MNGAAPAPGTRRLAVRHETHYRYDTAVEEAHHAAWLRPRDTEWQQVQGWTLSVDPLPQSDVEQSLDAFGNWRLGFNHAQVHEQLAVVSSFEAALAPLPPVQRGGPSWEQAAQALRYHSGVQQPDAVQFMLGSHFAPQHPRLAALAADLFTPGRPLIDAALDLMARVHARLAFVPQATDVATGALQVLEQGQGVCQDFAHLTIAALRSLGLAARYVSGYLLTHPPPGHARLVGADASHAWLALWCPQQGWVALDPTNNLVVAQDHVTLAWGRDYADVAPLRGVIRGGGSVPPSVAVTVRPV